MRITATFFLGALLIIVGGLALGFVSLDFSAPEDSQLTASGVLAFWDEDGSGGSYQSGWTEGGSESLYYEYEPESTGWSSYEEQQQVQYEEPQGTGWSSYEDQYQYEPESTGWSSYEEQYGIYADDYSESAASWGSDSWDEPAYGSASWGDDSWSEPDSGAGWWSRGDSAVSDEWEISDSASGEGSAWGGSGQAKAEDPWYVRSFPGFGQVAQQIIPGIQVTAPRPAPQPVVVRPTPPPPPVYPQPSCWITARPQSVASGGSSILEWQTFYASRADLSGVGKVPASGTRQVLSIKSDRTYALNVSGPGGTGSCHTQITIEAPSAAPSCIIAVHPTRISRGDTANLAWGAQNASSANLTGFGSVSTSGGRYISPSNSTTYTLTVSGSGGRTGACSARITVVP